MKIQSNKLLQISISLYRKLLKGYPKSFHKQFAEEMTYVFQQMCLIELKSNGIFGLIKITIFSFWDTLISIFREIISEGWTNMKPNEILPLIISSFLISIAALFVVANILAYNMGIHNLDFVLSVFTGFENSTSSSLLNFLVLGSPVFAVGISLFHIIQIQWDSNDVSLFTIIVRKTHVGLYITTIFGFALLGVFTLYLTMENLF